MDVRGMGWERVDGVYLAQGREKWRDVVKTIMNFRVP